MAGSSKRSAITVKFDTLGLRVRAPGDLTDSELDEALEVLAERAKSQENSALHQLEIIHASLEKFSLKGVQQCMQLDNEVSSRSESLKETIRQYFNSDAPQPTISTLTLPASQVRLKKTMYSLESLGGQKLLWHHSSSVPRRPLKGD